MAHHGQSRPPRHGTSVGSVGPSDEQFNPNPQTRVERKRKRPQATRPFGRSIPENHAGNNSSPSLFGTPNGSIAIHDGQFNATAGSHISVTINTGDQATPSPRPRPEPRRRKRTNKNVSAGQGRPVSHDEPQLRTSYQTYYLLLAIKGRGSALWIPGPNQNLSIDYRCSGVRCGDVGIITSQGSFDFVFNIFLPRDHPINSKGVPEGFIPLDPAELDLQKHSAFPKDSFLASNSIRKNHHSSNNELSFEVSASEGAVVTMPEGSVSEDVGNISRLRKYAKQNIESWYKYIICQRGREVRNGDVRLVTGYDNTSAWGMAAFSNPTEEGRPEGLRFATSRNSNSGNEYFWDYSGTAETKAGPGETEIEALRTMASDPEGTQYKNQSLFIRTLNTTFQDHVWQQLKADCDYEEGDEDENGSSDSGSFSSADSYFNRPFNPSSSNSRSQPNGRQGSNSSAGYYRSRAYAMDAHVDTSEAGGALTLHPSSTLNDYILRSAPSARMAITSDEDWMCLMTESDNTLPPADEICDRIHQSFEIRADEETVILSAKSSSVQSCPSRTSLDLSEIAGSSKLHSFPHMTSLPYRPYFNSYEIPLIRPLINTSTPPNSQSIDLHVEDSPFNPYPYGTADSDDSVSASLHSSPYPHKIYDNHLQYGTIGVLADYSYPQASLPISPSTETGNEHVAQPANPSDPYSRHLRPPRPVPPRHASETFMEDDLFRDSYSRDLLLVRPSKGPVNDLAPLYPHLSSDYRRTSAHGFGTTEAYRLPLTLPYSDELSVAMPEMSSFSLVHINCRRPTLWGIAMPTNRSLPQTPMHPSRLLSDWKRDGEDDFGDIPATAPPLSSMTIALPMPSSGKRSSSVSSSPLSQAVLLGRRKRRGDQIETVRESRGEGLMPLMPECGAYPTEVSMGRQTHDSVIPPPLVVPPFDHGPGLPMDNSLHSCDSAGIRTTLSSATDDRFIANRKRIDGSSSPREDITGEPSMLQEEQSLHLPPYPRGDTIGEGSQNPSSTTVVLEGFCDPSSSSLVDTIHKY